MVDFDAAVAAVQDPNADPVFLAKIAYENPEFGANVVANPRAYPGLKRWVAQFGDERARQQLVAMGWPVPQDGIMQQEAETASEQAQYQQTQQSSEVQYQAQYQPPATQQCQPEPFAATPASNMANDASTEYVDPYTNPADLSEVADFSPIQPQEPVASNAGFTAELAMNTEDQMLMAEIASKAPELHPFLARNPHIYRICSTGLPVSMIPPSTQPSVCDGNPLVKLGKSPTKAAKQGLIRPNKSRLHW